MIEQKNNLVDLFQSALSDLHQEKKDRAGRVSWIGDFLCKIEGLSPISYGEYLIFDGGNRGLVFDIDNEGCLVFLLGSEPVSYQEGVRATGSVFSIPVTEKLLGRVIDIEGNPLDGLPTEWDTTTSRRSIENEIKGIAERVSINKPLSTGILTIDALVPIGRGQRQLFIGNRGTGKTAAALNTIINQKNKNVICIYVALAQRQSHIARVVDFLEKNNALAYTIVICADAGKPSLHHYLAPYAGCSIAEYFADLKKDVLIIYDDLSGHATAYREMSLLMKRSPGREAYPGDVFYLHSRLLERAGNFVGGGSITALPIAQTLEDDISAYIPTNLISITDGQIFFDTKLFNTNIKPAIHTELSVSRVGGAAQPKVINKLSRALRLELAQYHELSAFTQFGTDLDDSSAHKIKRGKLLIELLKQSLKTLYSVEDEAFLLYLFRKHETFLYKVHDVKHFITWALQFMRDMHSSLYAKFHDVEIIDEYRGPEVEKVIRECFEIYQIAREHPEKSVHKQ